MVAINIDMVTYAQCCTLSRGKLFRLLGSAVSWPFRDLLNSPAVFCFYYNDRLLIFKDMFYENHMFSV